MIEGSLLPPPLYHYRAELVKVIDGDTIKVDIDHGQDIWQKNKMVRLSGINAPETRGEYKEAGKMSKEFLSDYLDRNPIVIHTEKDKKGKYGRLLAQVWVFNQAWVNVNQYMILQGRAKQYGEQWSDDELQSFIENPRMCSWHF